MLSAVEGSAALDAAVISAAGVLAALITTGVYKAIGRRIQRKRDELAAEEERRQRMFRALEIDIPEQLNHAHDRVVELDLRLAEVDAKADKVIESADLVARQLVTHMAEEERLSFEAHQDQGEWRKHVRTALETLKLDYEGLVDVIAYGKPVGRASDLDEDGG